jgi:6-phosphogluconolactonase
MKTPVIEVVSDAARLASRAAEVFEEEATNAIRERGRFTVALSGGSTPKRLYELLAGSSQLPWDQIHFFWSDERHVPPDHPDSNFKMAHEALLSKVPPANIHRIKAELPDPAAVARDYEQTLIDFFQLSSHQLPNFDLILLGMGADAHTASIFPGHGELLETESLVVSVWVEKLHTHRITMTMPVINAGRAVVFLVSGPEKAFALDKVLAGPSDPISYPAQAVNPTNGKLQWLIAK